MGNIFDHIQDHSRLGLDNKFLENKSRRIFLRSPGLLYKFLPTNLGVFKPTFYNFYTSHMRWNSTIYHTDLGQNAVFHNFSRQIALSQYSGRSIVGFKRNRSKILYCGFTYKTKSLFDENNDHFPWSNLKFCCYETALIWLALMGFFLKPTCNLY